LRGQVPSEGVLGITAGIDTQDNGFYYVVRAWGEFDESWLITEGFTDDFDILLNIINGRFKSVNSNQFIVNIAFQDAMGHRTAEVYEKLRLIPQIKPTRGEQRMASPFSISKIDMYPGTNKPIPGGLSLYRLNVTYYKDKLHAKLLIPSADPGAFHVHSEISEDYARQMVAEYRNELELWECPTGRPNHYWDCEVLAMAASDILGVKYWSNKIQEVEQKPKPQTSKLKVRPSRW
jgi:phage terminase large subunit GpA-like protein